ncbi:MAG: hypothetical protein ACRD5R_11640 [Candidatus Acidiferrales bacterium]
MLSISDRGVNAVRALLRPAAGFLIVVMAFSAAAAHKIFLLPRFTEAQSFRYQIETQTTTKGTTTSPIVNPEGASSATQSASLIVRFDVLDVARAATGTFPRTRLRVTYEQAHATSQSDAYDPQAAALDDQYAQLEGRSMEFTIEPDGGISNMAGLEDIFSKPGASQAVHAWMAGVTSGAGLPKQGIDIGEKWAGERPIEGVPLKNLAWRTQSSYLRDESCRPTNPSQAGGAEASGAAAPSGGPAISATPEDTCAVILTRLEIIRRGSSHADATPDDYLRNSLRTAGIWEGSGESLDSISLTTGMLVISTETTSQKMDYEIRSTRTGSVLHYQGSVQSQLQINLLPSPPLAGQKP